MAKTRSIGVGQALGPLGRRGVEERRRVGRGPGLAGRAPRRRSPRRAGMTAVKVYWSPGASPGGTTRCRWPGCSGSCRRTGPSWVPKATDWRAPTVGSQTPEYPSPSVTRTSTCRPSAGLSMVEPTALEGVVGGAREGVVGGAPDHAVVVVQGGDPDPGAGRGALGGEQHAGRRGWRRRAAASRRSGGRTRAARGTARRRRAARRRCGAPPVGRRPRRRRRPRCRPAARPRPRRRAARRPRRSGSSRPLPPTTGPPARCARSTSQVSPSAATTAPCVQSEDGVRTPSRMTAASSSSGASSGQQAPAATPARTGPGRAERRRVPAARPERPREDQQRAVAVDGRQRGEQVLPAEQQLVGEESQGVRRRRRRHRRRAGRAARRAGRTPPPRGATGATTGQRQRCWSRGPGPARRARRRTRPRRSRTRCTSRPARSSTAVHSASRKPASTVSSRVGLVIGVVIGRSSAAARRGRPWPRRSGPAPGGLGDPAGAGRVDQHGEAAHLGRERRRRAAEGRRSRSRLPLTRNSRLVSGATAAARRAAGTRPVRGPAGRARSGRWRRGHGCRRSRRTACSPQTNDASKSSRTARTASEAARDIAVSKSSPSAQAGAASSTTIVAWLRRVSRYWRTSSWLSPAEAIAFADDRQWMWRRSSPGTYSRSAWKARSLCDTASVGTPSRSRSSPAPSDVQRDHRRADQDLGDVGPGDVAGEQAPAGRRAGWSPGRRRSRRGARCGR